ncbi:MAG: DUF1016 domain-containing protein, partial [Verrucomicrobia bacterium]
MKKEKNAVVIQTKENHVFSKKEYALVLADLKKSISESQTKAILSVNKELICLYWKIGKVIVDKQEVSGWGTNVIEQLSKDLQKSFPGIEGFSRSNIFRMRAFYHSYRKVAQAVRQIENLPIFNIPWGHNILLLERAKNIEERFWYAQQAIDKGLSRSALEDLIEKKIYSRKGK